MSSIRRKRISQLLDDASKHVQSDKAKNAIAEIRANLEESDRIVKKSEKIAFWFDESSK